MDALHHPLRRATDAAAQAATNAPGAVVVDLRQVIYALSDALDLVGLDDVGHGKRVGTMAAACARAMGLPPLETTFLFDLGMLHDVGVSSSATHRRLVEEFDWDNARVHCEVGYSLLRDFAPLASLATPIRHHHTRWDLLRERADIDATVAFQANLVFMVDRVDALVVPHSADGSVLMHAARIRDQVRVNAGSYFAPDLVEAFLSASASEAFWLQLEPRGLQLVMQDMLSSQVPCQASVAEIKQLAEIFSRIVDAKSPFTAEHSRGVARLSRHIAERMGLGAESCDKIEIAGLLHDLGKLRIPDEILDKPGQLDDRERKTINAHSFETFQVLRHIRGFEDITAWAAHHHEEFDGQGYPFHVHAADLPLEARILRVADIFQALAQDRPYRQGLSAEEILGFLRDLVAQGRMEAEIVAVVAEDMPAAMTAAMAAAKACKSPDSDAAPPQGPAGMP